MAKNEQNKRFSFEFDEQGTKEVSQQIMNSYNSGFIGEKATIADSENFVGTES